MVNPSNLVVSVGARSCAIPLSQVVETMRALPVEAIAGSPPYVLGVAIVRGAPIVVVSLAALVGSTGRAAPTRFVTVRAGARHVALAVDGVEGVAELDAARLAVMPPLLGDIATIESLGARDERLLVVLDGARLLPDETPAP